MFQWLLQVREERDKESDEAQNDNSNSDSSNSSSTTAAVARSIHIVTRLTNTLGETALELLLTAGVATLAQVGIYSYSNTVTLADDTTLLTFVSAQCCWLLRLTDTGSA
jgi:hypothetical protein